MSAGSVLGFGLVFVAIAWPLSAVGGWVLARVSRRLASSGPLTERRAAEAVAIVPLALAAAMVATLMAHSALGPDHCDAHAHHAHLCLAHGSAWLDRVWVMVTLAAVFAAVLVRCSLLAAAAIQGTRSIAQLRSIGNRCGDVCIVDSDRAFGFVGGFVRPTIFVSTRAWSALDASERRALVAHESAHVRHGDLTTRFLLECALVLAAPFVAGRVRSMWMGATERLCDAHAAAETGDPAAVASAMVSLCKLNVARPASAFAFTPGADQLADRVRAVLARSPIGQGTAAVLTKTIAIVVVLLVGVSVLTAAPLHHAFETLLG